MQPLHHAVMRFLEQFDVIIRGGHFAYASGKHGSEYFNKDAVYSRAARTATLAVMIADRFRQQDVQVVAAPAGGAFVLAHWISVFLTGPPGSADVTAVFAEQSGDCLVFRRGFDRLVAHHNVLVVDDVLNAGGSARKVVTAVRTLGGTVLGVAALCNRGSVTAHDLGDVPTLFALIDMYMDAWDAAVCPLCAQGVPINTDIGHGSDYLARLQQT